MGTLELRKKTVAKGRRLYPEPWVTARAAGGSRGARAFQAHVPIRAQARPRGRAWRAEALGPARTGAAAAQLQQVRGAALVPGVTGGGLGEQPTRELGRGAVNWRNGMKPEGRRSQDAQYPLGRPGTRRSRQGNSGWGVEVLSWLRGRYRGRHAHVQLRAVPSQPG